MTRLEVERMEKDEAREERIRDEIVVDAYGAEEQALGWYYYLEEKLTFPFRARCICRRTVSPLEVGEEVCVVGMPPEEDCDHEMFVIIDWRRRPLTARPPGAESIEDVIGRARRFLDETLPGHSHGSRLLVVGHGGSVRGVIIAGLDLPTDLYRQLYLSHASLSIIELGDDPRIRLLNDTCHLDLMGTAEEEI